MLLSLALEQPCPAAPGAISASADEILSVQEKQAPPNPTLLVVSPHEMNPTHPTHLLCSAEQSVTLLLQLEMLSCVQRQREKTPSKKG